MNGQNYSSSDSYHPTKKNPTSNISHLLLRIIFSNPLAQFGKPWSVHKHLYKQNVKTQYVQTVFYLFIATKNYILPLSLFLTTNISLLSIFYHPTESVFSAVFPAEQIIQWVLRGWVKSTDYSYTTQPYFLHILSHVFLGGFWPKVSFWNKIYCYIYLDLLIYVWHWYKWHS